MDNSLDKVIVGNLAISPATLRRYLKKSHYWLVYRPDTETITLTANHNLGGEQLLEIRNASYENAERLARELGLAADGAGGQPCLWSKWNPVVELDHDGSEDAEALRLEMLRLGLPHVVRRRQQGDWAWIDSCGSHSPSMWTREMVLKLIREAAERYKTQLETLP